jgi:hypothetical protein
MHGRPERNTLRLAGQVALLHVPNVRTVEVKMTDQEMMLKISLMMGEEIREAIAGTPFSESFVAALVANESGGDVYATRFESSVFTSLAAVLIAHKPSFGSIGAQDLMKACWPESQVNSHTGHQPVWGFQQALLALVNLATSWGPTQIMGYHRIEFDFDLSELTSLKTHFKHTVELLKSFRERWNLDVTSWMPFFLCWNTGSPHGGSGGTFDPNYVKNGLARLELYPSQGVIA